MTAPTRPRALPCRRRGLLVMLLKILQGSHTSLLWWQLKGLT